MRSNLVGNNEPLDFGVEASLDNIPGYSTVNKFGEATDCDNGVETDAWDGANGSLSTDIWVPPTTARIHDIASSSGNDTAAGTGARTIQIWGLTSWDSDEVSEVATMDGTNNVETENAYVIIHRIKALTWGTGGLNAGNITATAQTDGTITAAILTGNNQTQMCIYGIPSTQNLRMTKAGCEVVKSGGAAITLEGEILVMLDPETNVSDNTAWTNKENFSAYKGVPSWEHEYNPPKKFNGPCIVKMRVVTDTNNSTATAFFDAVLKEV